MNHFINYASKLLSRTFAGVFITMLVDLTYFVGLREFLGVPLIWTLAATVPVLLLSTYIISRLVTNQSMEGLQAIWQGIWHITPGKTEMPAPNLDKIKNGRELISSMVMQIYDLASSGGQVIGLTGQQGKSESKTQTAPVLPTFDGLPVPVFILDKDKNIVLANKSAASYIQKSQEEIAGKPCFEVLKLEFTSNDTVDSWIEDSRKNKATDERSWEHVRAYYTDQPNVYHQCDISATYSRDNTAGHETVLVLWDRSKFYSQQDNGMSYIALAVHELRTPLTILRGYIEVFEEELDPHLTPELREFMRKMGAASQSLSAFVSNILNVARIDENQLVLSLHEAKWADLLHTIVEGLQLRAGVRGKTILLEVPDNLPNVAVDEISIYEVVSNLVDNAVKYSGPSPKIIVKSYLAKDGTIETVVQDFGVGIPSTSLQGLFTKYYRSHRTRNAVSGSGLGLYLVKAIVSAHGGRVWVESKEGEGSTFGFSLQPYSAVKGEVGEGEKGIERQASGWIKNHTIYR